MVTKMVTLKELRKQVEKERKKAGMRSEKKRLQRELFMLKNPNLVRTARGFKILGKKVGKGIQRQAQEMAKQQRKQSRRTSRRSRNDEYNPFGLDI